MSLLTIDNNMAIAESLIRHIIKYTIVPIEDVATLVEDDDHNLPFEAQKWQIKETGQIVLGQYLLSHVFNTKEFNKAYRIDDIMYYLSVNNEIKGVSCPPRKTVDSALITEFYEIAADKLVYFAFSNEVSPAVRNIFA